MGVAGADLGLPDVRTLLGRGEEAVIDILITLYAGFQASTRQTLAKPLIALEDFSIFFGIATVFELGEEPGAGVNFLLHDHFG